MVDDDGPFLEQAEIFLNNENDGFNIDSTISAKDALKMLERADFDAVISDYMMPEMDGLELLKAIRKERESDVPFVVFTGKGREEVAMKALNYGANRYLQKGGSPKSQYCVLAQAISQEVEHYKTKREQERYVKELEFMNDVMVHVSRMDDNDKICKYIVDKIHSLDERNYVTISLYDREKETIRIRAVSGFGEFQPMVEDMLFSGEDSLTFDPEELDSWLDVFSSGELELMPEGLYTLVMGVLSKEEAREIEELLGIEKAYSVGFALDEKPYGGISILTPTKEEFKFKSAIETISSYLSVSFQKKQAERQLKKIDKK